MMKVKMYPLVGFDYGGTHCYLSAEVALSVEYKGNNASIFYEIKTLAADVATYRVHITDINKYELNCVLGIMQDDCYNNPYNGNATISTTLDTGYVNVVTNNQVTVIHVKNRIEIYHHTTAPSHGQDTIDPMVLAHFKVLPEYHDDFNYYAMYLPPIKDENNNMVDPGCMVLYFNYNQIAAMTSALQSLIHSEG